MTCNGLIGKLNSLSSKFPILVIVNLCYLSFIVPEYLLQLVQNSFALHWGHCERGASLLESISVYRPTHTGRHSLPRLSHSEGCVCVSEHLLGAPRSDHLAASIRVRSRELSRAREDTRGRWAATFGAHGLHGRVFDGQAGVSGRGARATRGSALPRAPAAALHPSWTSADCEHPQLRQSAADRRLRCACDQLLIPNAEALSTSIWATHLKE